MKPEDKAKVQQALDALEDATQTTAYNDDREYHYHICCGSMLGNAHMSDCKQSKASTALRQLLEQSESVQEPMFYWDMDCFFVRPERAKFLNLDVDAMQALYATPQAQPSTDHSVQDLDMADHGDELTIAYLDGLHTGKQIAKREWVGLEKADMPDGDNPMYDHDYFIKGMIWADVKLREKNGGA
jgi:hypothetical protein